MQFVQHRFENLVVAMETTWGKIDELLQKVQHLEKQLGPAFARLPFLHSGTPSKEAEAFVKSKGPSQFLDEVRGNLPGRTLAETLKLLAENMMDDLLRGAHYDAGYDLVARSDVTVQFWINAAQKKLKSRYETVWKHYCQKPAKEIPKIALASLRQNLLSVRNPEALRVEDLVTKILATPSLHEKATQSVSVPTSLTTKAASHFDQLVRPIVQTALSTAIGGHLTPVELERICAGKRSSRTPANPPPNPGPAPNPSPAPLFAQVYFVFQTRLSRPELF